MKNYKISITQKIEAIKSEIEESPKGACRFERPNTIFSFLANFGNLNVKTSIILKICCID